jgi:hypothetical protein
VVRRELEAGHFLGPCLLVAEQTLDADLGIPALGGGNGFNVDLVSSLVRLDDHAPPRSL